MENNVLEALSKVNKDPSPRSTGFNSGAVGRSARFRARGSNWSSQGREGAGQEGARQGRALTRASVSALGPPWRGCQLPGAVPK